MMALSNPRDWLDKLSCSTVLEKTSSAMLCACDAAAATAAAPYTTKARLQRSITEATEDTLHMVR